MIPLAIPIGIALVGSYLSGKSEKEAGKQQKRINEAAAVQELASGQLRASEQKRAARLVASRAVALAAASGGTATDSTVMDIVADIDGEGAYRAALEMYEAEGRAQTLRLGGQIAEQQGKQNAIAGYINTASTILGYKYL